MPRFEAVAREICSQTGYEYQGFIGSGAFKECYKAGTERGDLIAIKVIDPANYSPARSDREIEAMQQCRSVSLAELVHYDTYRLDGVPYLYFVESFLAGGSLASLLLRGPVSASVYRNCFRSVLSALAELERHKIVHRDIKPENMLFADATLELCVLTDFGIVRNLSATSLTQTWLPHGPGTPLYSSPEQLNNEKDLIDWRSDQFSAGLTLAESLLGIHPYLFGGATPAEAVGAIANRQRLPPETKKAIEEKGEEKLLRLLSPWPVGRFSSIADLST